MSFRGLGQFHAADSLLHRLDPRAKILAVLLIAAGLFLVESIAGLLAVGAFVTALVVVARIPLPGFLRMLRPVALVVAFTAIFQVLFVREGDLLFSLWVVEVYSGGLRLALFLALRILVLVAAAALLTATTSPISLTDGLEDLLSPLKKLRFPSHEVAMMMTIALRFIPTLYDEARKITTAQKARGADFESGGLIGRLRALLPMLIPLTVGAFARADELAEAMESRGYAGGGGRTRYRELRFGALDAAALVVAALVPLGGLLGDLV
ncbi:energy-coupling factor transporter transmembrane component T family protein [Rubrobacter aplysinae]|uniref:energy-coupling factor transporter transmembrane component T family protein n=1 Tax=Rubrobacter aplysinae TaxID=909625 RepID=UPI00064B9E5B|nr:energy-coupling factor transporter transmembrane component T [Rubrobacter aplysinae]